MGKILRPPGIGLTRSARYTTRAIIRAKKRAAKRTRYTGNYMTTVYRPGLQGFGRGMKSARKKMRKRKILMRRLQEAGY